jgi:hypothetical protein
MPWLLMVADPSFGAKLPVLADDRDHAAASLRDPDPVILVVLEAESGSTPTVR